MGKLMILGPLAAPPGEWGAHPVESNTPYRMLIGRALITLLRSFFRTGRVGILRVGN